MYICKCNFLITKRLLYLNLNPVLFLMKKNVDIYVFSFFAMFVYEAANAQPPPPGLPIDGGILFLAISGIAFGVYKLKRKK